MTLIPHTTPGRAPAVATPRGQCRGASWAILLLVVVFLVCPEVMGQSPESQPATSQPAEVPAILTKEDLQARLAAVEAATDMPEGARVEAANLYRQAIEQLGQSESWRQKTEEYRKGREEAPTLLESVRNRLSDLSQQAGQPTTIDAPADMPLEQLTQKLADAEAELKTRQDAVGKLDEESRQRADRRAAIPDLLAAATSRLEQVNRSLGEAPGAVVVPQVQLARRSFLAAQRTAAQEEIAAYQAELQFYDARSDVLTARRDEARTLVGQADARVAAWRKTVTERREAAAAQQRAQARSELESAPPAIRELAQSNTDLAAEWTKLGTRIKTVDEETQAVQKLAASIGGQFDKLKTYSELTEMSDLLGPLLRKQRGELARLRRYERDLDHTRSTFSRVQVRIGEIDAESDDLLHIDEAVAEQLAQAASADVHLATEPLRPKVQELLTSRRDTLIKLKRDYEAYSTDLIEYSAALSVLLARAEQVEQFVRQRVLWVPSTSPIHRMKLPEGGPDLAPTAEAVGASVWVDISQSAWVYLLALSVYAALLSLQVRIRRDLRRTCELVAKPVSARYWLTLQAVLDTVAMAAPLPFLLAFAGWRLNEIDVADAEVFELARAISLGLLFAAYLYFSLRVLRHASRHSGLAAGHFRWNEKGLRVLRLELIWAAPVVTPLAGIVAATEASVDPAWSASIGRLAFVAAMVCVSVFSWRVLQPNRGALSQRYRKRSEALTSRARWLIFAAAVLLPVVLAGASVAGYHYTAIVFALGLVNTAVLMLVLVLAHALAVRWVFHTQRKLAIAEATKKRSEQAAQASGDTATATEPMIDDAQLQIGTIGGQTRQLLNSFAWVGVLIIVWVSWADLLPALSFLDDVTLWSYTSEVVRQVGDDPAATTTGTVVETITLANVILAVLVIALTAVLARNIPGLMEILFLRRLPLDTGARFAVNSISRYVIVVVGVAVTFSAVGIGWSKVQWLIAAVTVGLGFGLQEIFANFISGLILLFERPIRIGDTVTVGDITGTVTRIRIRATTIINWDRKELVIPNKEFVTGQVVNWSLSDPVLRLVIKVGIAYGSDVELAKKSLVDIARQNPRVLDQPKPHVWFMEFGDSSLNLELRAFVKDIEDWMVTRDALHCEIDAAFRKAGIEIAFPQRDLHIRSIEQSLPIVHRTAVPAGEALPVERE